MMNFQQKSRNFSRLTIAGILAMSLLLTILMSSCGNGDESPASSTSTAPASAPNKAKAPAYPTQTVRLENIERPVRVTGRVVPLQEITISAQVQGKVLPMDKLLQEGKFYRRGEKMVRIDNERLHYELQAQRSKLVTSLVGILSDLSIDYSAAQPTWEQFTRSIQPAKRLPAFPEMTDDQLNFFISARGIPSQYFSIKAREATLDDYTIQAPFSGVLTSANVDPGSIVSPGMPLATLSRTDVYEVRAAVPAATVSRIRPGQKVDLYATNLDAVYTATVNRFGSSIDAATQTVTAFLRVSGKQLRTGLYLEGELPGQELNSVAILPKEALTRDNQVYLINDSVVVAKAVTPVLIESDKVYLHGLAAGDRVITQQAKGPIVGTKAR